MGVKSMLGSQSYWNSVVSLYLTPGKQAIRAVVVGRSELDLLHHRLSHELLVELRVIDGHLSAEWSKLF